METQAAHRYAAHKRTDAGILSCVINEERADTETRQASTCRVSHYARAYTRNPYSNITKLCQACGGSSCSAIVHFLALLQTIPQLRWGIV